MEFDAFTAAGIYEPDAPNAAERREFLAYLLSRGHAVDEIVTRSRRITAGPFFQLLSLMTAVDLPTVPLAQAAAEASLDEQEIVDLLRILGIADDPESDGVPEEFVEHFVLYRAACELYGRDRTIGFAQVIGTSIASILEAGRELVLGPLAATHGTELEFALGIELGNDSWEQIVTLVGDLMRRQRRTAPWFVDAIMQGDVMVAVAFIDLVGSTGWTAGVSPELHADALRGFEQAATRLATLHGCRVVKFIGDEAMIVGHEPAAVAEVTAKLCAAVAENDGLPAVRAAIGWGRVAPRAGDYFGEVVNLVARATKEAPLNGIVVTPELATHLSPSHWHLTEPRLVALRGIDGEVELLLATIDR